MDFYADMDKLHSVWPEGPKCRDAEDFFRVAVDLGSKGKITADTHLFPGRKLTILPYSDFDSLSRDARGNRHTSGDSALAEAIQPGEIVFAIKHHRCSHRLLDQKTAAENLKEHLKLQDTHIQLAAGVMDRGRGQPGVVTLNSPQSYPGESGPPGRFGTDNYPMIFVKPTFPVYLPAEIHPVFVDNIRTMAVAFNAVAKFPGNGRYNGGDPLAANTPEQVVEHVTRMVLAIAATGDRQRGAREWFSKPENLIYCAEFAFIAATAGCLCPLNITYLEGLVGEKVARNFIAILDKQASGHKTELTRSNPNKMANLVTVAIAPSDLKPMPEYASAEQLPLESTKLAFEPFTPADIVDHAMRLHFDREKQGESIAPVQAAVMQKMQAGFIEMLNLDGSDADPVQRRAAKSVYGSIISIVGTQHSSYQEFRNALDPVLALARELTSGKANNGHRSKLFVPPSLFHIVARHEHTGGLLGLDYIGHGFHLSLVYQ